MYAKLFRNNIKKVLEDYIVYFFTLVISSALFFAFLSLTSRYNDILGMEPGVIAKQFFGETFVFGIVAVIAGCTFGTAISGMMTAFVMRTITGSGAFRFGFYPDTIIVTLLFFGAAFILVGVWNIRRINKIRLIDLLNEKKASEGQRKRKAATLLRLSPPWSVLGLSVCRCTGFPV